MGDEKKREIISSIPLSESDMHLRRLGCDLLTEYFDILGRADFNISYTVLELASGSGRAGAIIARQGYYLIACDITNDLRDRHKHRIGPDCLHRVDYLSLDMATLPFRDNSIENIACVNTIHELDNPLNCVEELIRVTSPAGKLLITDFNKKGFGIISAVHKASYGTEHSEGSLQMSEAAEILFDYFQQVEIFDTELNRSCICSLKRSS